jgi:SAM-dependent methyltransferase
LTGAGADGEISGPGDPPGESSTSYDEVPYEGGAFSLSHPDHLQAAAGLFGLDAPAPDGAAILELGCGTGGNLLPMADSLPEARLLGIDLSARQIAVAREAASAAGLGNVEFRRRSIIDLDERIGRFDYVICHGVYSWVPREVREGILAVCRRHLSPNGVAYISYNTYPGWHLRAQVREMMGFHAGRFQGAEQRIAQARALLDFLIEATDGHDGLYQQLLREELERVRDRPDSYLFHEHLEEHNEPEYFHRFMTGAANAGLAYLGEARFGDMLPLAFSREVRDTLARIAPDIIHMEQYLDFLRNRLFRRTLLCHREVRLEREIDGQRLSRFRLLSPLAPTEPDPDGGTRFAHSEGSRITVYDAFEAAVLERLGNAWPASVPCPELAAEARRRVADASGPSEDDLSVAAGLALRLLSAGLLDIRSAPDRFRREAGERPRACALARLQARDGGVVTNLRHQSVHLEPLELRVLPWLDGSRDRSDLARDLASLLSAERFQLDGPDPVPELPSMVGVEALVDGLLRTYARTALLAG